MLQYCSVGCFKVHSERHAEATQQHSKEEKPRKSESGKVACLNPSKLETFGSEMDPIILDDTQFAGLDSDAELYELVNQSPELQKLLKEINSSKDPRRREILFDEAMHFMPKFREFSDRCLLATGYER